ncbi:L-glutamate gamma-semialdehyde dehydrogenase [Cryptosporangium aurantiacum]|uniref:L-glutamate gamma-semialdehyde dehydrogenase n=1 Tax=Cryptosporangium aurantiacum TaxID=134849 RepID=A0A1M7RNM1_9ACTN|nr:L-glutamate gamma-semialdehyde dehydrogenase [Cryptosporangium aurantiacum]SHN47801.1 delta-1-pyrroline-5-carboxylate dehydrogenase [Cryptosporangium aurantiacum]
MDGVTRVPEPVNEPVRTYAPGSAERRSLQSALDQLADQREDLTQTIGGEARWGGGDEVPVIQPHAHAHLLGTLRQATRTDVTDAIAAAAQAAPAWQAMSYADRAAIFLRAADLVAGKWRDVLNAATMLGQSKTVAQAEIDSACELIDFLRFNVHFGERILAEQPNSGGGAWNRFDHRPLEGFVLAITPFNFTAIAGNLPTAPALMGNTVLWKPSPTQQLSAHFFMRVLEEAGVPPGVINLVTGDGAAVSEVALSDRNLAGIHFTGSTRTFRYLWEGVGRNLDRYAGYPRLVGETGGKDFVVAHPSADPDALHTALVRGAFEYQGQKCSAASRAYLPRSLWEGGLRDRLATTVEELEYGDVRDFRHFGGAVIDRRAFDRLRDVLAKLEADPSCSILAGGGTDDSVGWFVRPTVVVGTDPTHELFRTEYFGPLLGVHVYDDAGFDAVLDLAADSAPYALTGAVFGRDRAALVRATERLRFAAGNFYLNDKPTGAVVGQQPFGGARASGTNDKAGSILNLLRWVSPRTIKETFAPPTDHRYPHMSGG